MNHDSPEFRAPIGDIDWTEQQIHSNSDEPQMSYEEQMIEHLRTSRIQMWLLVTCSVWTAMGVTWILLRTL
jgi:hypothetical protein